MSKTAETPSIASTWAQMLEVNKAIYNEIRAKEHESPSHKEKITLPFISVEIEAHSLYQLWPLVAPFLMNSNTTALECVVDEQNRLQKIYLQRSTPTGIYISLEPISLDQLPLKQINVAAIDTDFEILKTWLKEKEHIDLGNLRVIQEKILADLIEINARYAQNSNNDQFILQLGEYCDEITSAMAWQSLNIYPASPLFSFLSQIKAYFGNFSFRKLAQFLQKNMPTTDCSVTFIENNLYVPYLIHSKPNSIQLQYLHPNPELQKIENVDDRERQFLLDIKKTTKFSANYTIHLSVILKFCRDLLDSPIPFDGNRVKYLLQEFLQNYRSFGKVWQLYPKPLLYNGGMRFFSYLMGYRLNLQKISYWSLPTILEYISNKFSGMTGHIVLIMGNSLTDLSEKNETRVMMIKLSEDAKNQIQVFQPGEIEALNSEWQKMSLPETLTEPIHPDTKQKGKKSIVPDPNILNLRKYRLAIMQKYGFINSLIWIRYGIFETLIQNIFLDFNSRSIIAVKNIVKMLTQIKETANFAIVPTNIVYETIQNTPASKLLKFVAPIMTDLNEF